MVGKEAQGVDLDRTQLPHLLLFRGACRSEAQHTFQSRFPYEDVPELALV